MRESQPGGAPMKNQDQVKLAISSASILGQVGCVTFILVAAALGAGLGLDALFDTQALFTILLVLASFPLTIYLIIRIVLRGTKNLQELNNPEKDE
jgi:F0F1-type ATP synthase assembly protein I